MEFYKFCMCILYVPTDIYNLFSECLKEKGKTELDEDECTGIMNQGRECSRQVIPLYGHCRIKPNNVGKIHHRWAVGRI